MMFSFERLNAYSEARLLVAKVYGVLAVFPKNEQFALTAQIQRSIVSVPSNIAEGSGRHFLKEKIHFLDIAYGSLMEAYCQLQIALDLNYIDIDTFEDLKTGFYSTARLISGLSRKFQNDLKSPIP